MNDKVKTLIVAVLLSFTCFLTQCKGCLDVDNETHQLVPGQVVYTVSCGFPAPYFDVEIMTAPDEGYDYRVKNSDSVNIATAVNVFVIIALYAFVLFLVSRKRINLNRLLGVTSVLVLLFSSSLLVPYFHPILQQMSFYLYAYPVMGIQSLFDLLKLDAIKGNASPRIYLVLLILIIYFAIPLLVSFKNKLMLKLRR
ncbi:MAG TPA: hypothetical protein PK358_13905 [Spirochaetota bacterium]|nr:hypothetical protein [Spirochaetota bacterium]HPJ35928.1 hypothetical protein [Spirochaetota bacterium]